MSEANKEVIRRWVNEVFNNKALGSIGDLKISDYLDHSTYPGPPRSLEGFKQILQMLLNAFPDYHCTIAELVAEGDRVVCINNWRATHQGSFMGISPTNKAVSGTRIDMFRMVGDKMAEHWGTGDELGMMNSLGILRQSNGNGASSSKDKWGTEPKSQPVGGATEAPAWGGTQEAAKTEAQYGTSTAEQNRQNTAVVRRALEEVWGKGNLSVIPEIYQSTYVAHSPTVGEIQGTEGVKQVIAAYRGAFPDITFTTEDLLSQGDKVVTRWTARGTQKGEFFGAPATGKRMTFTGLEIHRLTAGKIAETWGIWQQVEETGYGSGVYNENKTIARRFIEEVYNQRNITAVNELVADNCVDRFKQSVSMFLILTAVPDFRISIEEIVAEADKVAVRSTLYGTHSASFLGIPASGRPITTNRIDVFRLEGGKIIESWQNWDNWNLMTQIGAYRLPG